MCTERYQRLIDLQERISLQENQAQIGRTVELLVATGEGRKDAATARMSGRARDGRLVHFTPGDNDIRPGDIVTTTVTGAAPHHLIADAAAGEPSAHPRRRRPRGRAAPRHRRRTGACRGSVRRTTAAAIRRMWLLSNEGDFERFKDDLAAVERKVTREFDSGPRAMVVAILVFVVLLSFVLPHTGSSKGFDVLVGDATAVADGISLPSRVFTWLALVFSVGFSTLALITRRWALAWVALAGSAVASALGMLAVWSRQTAAGHPGPGIGLILGLAGGDRADLPLGAGGVVAHRAAAGGRGGSSPPGRGATAARRARHPRCRHAHA